ncbi:uncharacterized protein CCOS01_05670 [Colletotrichum costaricense]|uniref:Uncharacterized protein n=1 Tax=Colletotrichum costaricense TaxID=1209916 RepID=A0AAI9Z0K3_9PEZI|nr:uncharacterized protein CCOS01_05670 [Colletotrichum costaricense]KAK1530567.1 hypothetical protein CCOS01_05670 [Colletotrichum costaricense]
MDLIPALANDCLERLAGYMPATCRREQSPFFAVLQLAFVMSRRNRGSKGKHEGNKTRSSSIKGPKQDGTYETSFRRPYNTRIAFRIRTQFMLCFPDGSPRSLIATSLVDGQSDAADPQHSSQASLQSGSSRGKSNWGNTPEALAPDWGSTHENESECGELSCSVHENKSPRHTSRSRHRRGPRLETTIERG